MLTYRKIHSPAEEAQPKCNQQPIYPHLYHRFLLQTEARGDDTTCKRYEKKNESPKSLQPFMECYINKQDWRNSCIAGYFRSQSKTLWKKKIDSTVLTLSLLGEYTPLWDFQKIWQVQNHQSSKLLYHQSTNYLVSYPEGKQCKHEQQL